TATEQIQHHADDEHDDEDSAAAADPIVRIAIIAAAEPAEEEQQNDNDNEEVHPRFPWIVAFLPAAAGRGPERERPDSESTVCRGANCAIADIPRVIVP